jgi:hypothetical protein
LGILKRLPRTEHIISVYAVIVLMTYGWTIYRYIWEVPSWLYFLRLTDILGIYAYALALNLIESLLVLAALLALCLMLPRKWMCEAFVAHGSTLVILLLGYLMHFSSSFPTIKENDYPQALVHWTPAILVAIILLAAAAGRIPLTRRLMEDVSSRAVIFLYLSVPASVISLVVVLIRNIFWSVLHG